MAYFSRYSSLASMVSAVFAPFFYLLGDRTAWYAERSILLAIFLMGMLLVARHSENIRKLMQGRESRLGARKKL